VGTGVALQAKPPSPRHEDTQRKGEVREGIDPPPVPVFQPYIGVDTVKSVVDALDMGWLGMGATTKAFEDAIAARLGLRGRHVLATNTGTSAIHLGLLAADVGPGDEVIVASFNFVADHQAILMTGAEPVFCDIEDDTLGLDPGRIETLITPRTKAILPLHFAGIPSRIDEVYRIAERHGLRVVEDATHAFGTLVDGRPVGSFGDITCFSFDPVKVVTSIDGGAVVVNSEDELNRIARHRLLGIDRDTAERYKNGRAWQYDVVSGGFRYHLTNVNASIGLSQLSRLDEFIASRQQSCRLYSRLLRDVAGVRVPASGFEGVSPFIYYIRVPAEAREALIADLARQGIAVGIHFLGAHEFSFLSRCRRDDLQTTRRVTTEVLTLPLHSFMPAALVERVANAIRRFMIGA
jgi:dTDP-4-amino-4,6-dideoxygalactose transaminase